MIYTSTFWHPTELPRYSIALYQPFGMMLPTLHCLVPPVAIFRAYRANTITWGKYTEEYLKMLDQNEMRIIDTIYDLHNPVLCCWEKNPAKCHRSLSAQWLTQHGLSTEELT